METASISSAAMLFGTNNINANTGSQSLNDNGFANVLGQAAKNDKTNIKAETKSDISGSDTKASLQSGMGKINDSKLNDLKTKNDFISDDKSRLYETLDKFSGQIKDVLMSKLDISEEELTNALAELGLTYIDCLQPSNLAMLMAKLSGNADTMAILTNETLFIEFSRLTQAVSDITDELLETLNISKDELNILIEDFKQNANSVLEADAMVTNMTENTNAADAQKQNVIADENVQTLQVQDNANTLKENANTKDMTVNSDEKTDNEDMSDENDINLVITRASRNSKDYQSSLGQQYEGSEDLVKAKEPETAKVKEDNPQSPLVSNFTERLNEVITENQEAVRPYSEGVVNVRDILSQINSQIKLALNGDESKIQFQLNPEYLGKVTVQIASKAGVLTAQLAAENQAVKEAIESQIVQLRENMTNQGIKVEAVEVTIESHEFERNLDNNEKNQEAFERENKSMGRKQIRYDDIDDLDELPEDEALVAKMMVAQGNKVNYTA